ncbi:concanavalin A-like lectin/glucanase domain-containing protein, partial [Peziza echinospora]
IVASPMLLGLVQAQTWSLCNPMKKECPKDPALGGVYSHKYGGAAPGFDATGSAKMVQYKSDGGHFIVEKSGDAPTITSQFYIMYGKLDAVILAAPGGGIVSSLVMLSDTLDEIDWEWIGSDVGQAQTNYFGKGNTETYDRGAYHPVNHQEFHDYGIEWTPEFVKWSIDGVVVRTLTPSQVKGDFFPQSPMQIKLGSWSGGDPANDPGVIQWSQGPTNYKAGPFHMIVKSIDVHDYSTGNNYYYSDKSGSAASIRSDTGKINVGPGNVTPGDPEKEKPKTTTTSASPTSTSGSNNNNNNANGKGTST